MLHHALANEFFSRGRRKLKRPLDEEEGSFLVSKSRLKETGRPQNRRERKEETKLEAAEVTRATRAKETRASDTQRE